MTGTHETHCRSKETGAPTRIGWVVTFALSFACAASNARGGGA